MRAACAVLTLSECSTEPGFVSRFQPADSQGARRDEKIFPDGQDSVNVAGLGAEEHLAAIHADQFHRLLRADSFDDFQDM